MSQTSVAADRQGLLTDGQGARAADRLGCGRSAAVRQSGGAKSGLLAQPDGTADRRPQAGRPDGATDRRSGGGRGQTDGAVGGRSGGQTKRDIKGGTD